MTADQLDPHLLSSYTVEVFANNKYSEYKDAVLRLIHSMDLDIEEVGVEKHTLTADSLPADMPEELKSLFRGALRGEAIAVRTVHNKYDPDGRVAATEVFDLEDQESEGTKKLFALAGPLVDTLKTGKVLVVDGLDTRLHPLLTREIVSLFNSNHANRANAQLLFTTQDTNLLSNRFFRRDQVWFIEKDRHGASHLYSLAEYRPRNDATFGNDYIKGKYGAIPYIGDLEAVLGGTDA